MKNYIFAIHFTADVVELVDTLDLGSSAARRGGSTPFIRTKKQLRRVAFFILLKRSCNRSELTFVAILSRL